MEKIISVANQKGGVGKTDLAVNLSATLAIEGHKTMLIDLDPQASATHYLTDSEYDATITDVLLDDTNVDDAIVTSCVTNLDVIPSTLGLGGALIRLANDVNMQFKLRKALEKSQKKFDFVIIDTPPSLGILTVNAFAASHGVIVPVQPNFFSLKGLSDLLDTINQIQEMINPKLKFYGIIMTMFDRRNNLSTEVQEILNQRFGKRLFSTVIPISVKLAEAPSHKKPILQYSPKHKVSDSYRQLSQEFIKCVRN